MSGRGGAKGLVAGQQRRATGPGLSLCCLDYSTDRREDAAAEVDQGTIVIDTLLVAAETDNFDFEAI